MAEVTFSVSEIHCGGCQARIQRGLGRLDGVRRVTADQHTQTVTVAYNEQTVGGESLAEQLETLGFRVRPEVTE